VPAYFLITGIALLTLAAALFFRRMRAALHGVTVTGRVRAHSTSTMDEGTAYLPVVEFTDANGAVHRFTSVAGRSARIPGVGAEIAVRYLPSNPKIAYIQSFLHMWAAPVACAALGFAALFCAWQR
jgi:hypothetical protein